MQRTYTKPIPIVPKPYTSFTNARTRKPWHMDLKDADLERMLEKLEAIANDVELAVDAICERLGEQEDDEDTEEEEPSSPVSKVSSRKCTD